jgi:hypothetical protein
VKIVLHLVPEPQKEPDEDDDFQDDEFDLGEGMAELSQPVGMAGAPHTNLHSPADEICTH